jgi:ureidoglycolate amidohydrolase
MAVPARTAGCPADVRDTNGSRRDGVVKSILESAKSIAQKRKVRVETQMINQDPPATCNDRIQAAIAASAKALGLSTKHMVSRAYHDALFMARIAPTGMIFISCKGGFSHRPDEFASESDIGNGVEVLALTMAQLSEGTWADGSTAADGADAYVADAASGRDEL